MFTAHDAKRVRREDLNRSDDSDGAGGADDELDFELQARLNAQIAERLGLVQDSTDISQDTGARAPREKPPGRGNPSSDGAAKQRHAQLEDDASSVEDDGFDFRLFSTADAAPKVTLEDDEIAGEGGFVQPLRPSSFYLAPDATSLQRERFMMAAVSADDVLERSRQRHWGLELPWRVISIQATRKQTATASGKVVDTVEENADITDNKKRKRPGKKRRIAQRTRKRMAEAKKAASAKQKVEKEEHIKDKKKRMNRAKKLRKRAKKREEKQDEADDGDRQKGNDSGEESDE